MPNVEALERASIAVGSSGPKRKTSMLGTFSNHPTSPGKNHSNGDILLTESLSSRSQGGEHRRNHSNTSNDHNNHSQPKELTEAERELAEKIRAGLKKKYKSTAKRYFWSNFDQHDDVRNNLDDTQYEEEKDEDENEHKAKKEPVPIASISEVFSFLESGQTKLLFGVGCIASFCSGLVFPALAFLFSNSFSDLSQASNDMSGVNEIAFTFLGLGAFAFVAAVVQNGFLEIAASRASRNFSLQWFEALLRQDVAFYDVYDVSSFASNLSSNSKKVKIGLGRKFGEGLQFATCTVGGLVYAFYESWRISLVILVLLPVVAVSAVAVMKFNQGRTAFASKAYANSGSVAYQTVSGIKTILSLNAIPEMIKQYKKATAGAYKYSVTPLWKEGIANGSMLASFIFLYLILTIYGSRLIYQEVQQNGCDPTGAIPGAITCENTGTKVFAAMLGVAFAGQGMGQIANFMEAFGNARAAAYPAMKAIGRSSTNKSDNREEKTFLVKRKSDGEVALQDITNPSKQQRKERDPENGSSQDQNTYVLPKYTIDSSSKKGLRPKVQGAISFKNVCFSYPTRPHQRILNHFNLEIPAGSTVALVGPSGGGKSTVVSMVERFYDPNISGSIHLDGHDLREINVSYLRHHIGLVGQEPVLFADTIAANIANGLGSECSKAHQKDIENAAKMANAHDFIKSFPKGYKTQVGDKGAQLSGGQKQRIAIARALLKNPELLLLDEATSALDTESELIVQEAIDQLLSKNKQRTTIIIAHRLTTIRKADIIVFIKDGKVAEIGSHEELMKSELGLYRYLVEKQSTKTTDDNDSVNEGDSNNNRNQSTLDLIALERKHAESESPKYLIQFKDVKFYYPSRPDKIILDKFNLNIRKGETIAFVGPSGGGKSTTVGLIERFYDPVDGSIRFDHKKIKHLNVGWLRHQIGYVGQEPTLFNASIAANIRLGAGVSDVTFDEIVKAAKQANAHDFIMSFNNGYNTEVGERGTQLSGGQKQRIAIARALVKKPKVLLLDEATSALDSQSEHVVQEAIDKLMLSHDHTTVVIAHRLSTIRNADRIAFIADGIVKEIGSHDELMAKSHGRYRRLVESQKRSSTVSEEVLKKATSDNQEDKKESKKSKKKDKDEVDEEEKKFDPKWARGLAKKDINFLLVGTVGIVMAGAVFPTWGIMFGNMINTLFYPIFPCSKEIIESTQNAPPGMIDCEAFPLPGCFLTCEEYWTFSSEEIEKESFVLAGYWALIIICCLVGNTLSFIGFGTASERMNKRIRDDTFTALVRQEVAYFDVRSTGNITSQLEEDTTKIQTFSGEPIRTFFLNISSVVVGVTVSFIYMWEFALMSLAIIPLMGFATAVEFKLMLGVDDGGDEKDELKSSGGIAVETLLNMKTVASLSLEKQRYSAFNNALEDTSGEEVKSGMKTGFTRGLSIIIQQYVNALQFWWGGWLLNRFPEKYDFNDFLISMFALLFSLFALGAAAIGVTDRDEATKAATRIYNLIHRKSLNDPLTKKDKSSSKIDSQKKSSKSVPTTV